MSPELRLLIVIVVVLVTLAVPAGYELLATWMTARRMRITATPLDDDRCSLRKFRNENGGTRC